MEANFCYFYYLCGVFHYPLEEMNIELEDNNALIIGLKNGDKASFDEVFRYYYSDLVNYCNRYVNDDDSAKEIVQDIFTKLWFKHEDININVSLKSYLYKAVRNHAINHLNYIRQRERFQQYIGFPSMSNQNTPLNKLQEEDIKIRLDRTILTMPDKCREVFELKRFEGLKNKDIAEQLGISLKTVEKHIAKAISLLKDTLHDYVT